MNTLSIPGRFEISARKSHLFPFLHDLTIAGITRRRFPGIYDIPACERDGIHGLRDSLLPVIGDVVGGFFDIRPLWTDHLHAPYDAERDGWYDRVWNRFSCLTYAYDAYGWLVDDSIAAPMPIVPREEWDYAWSFPYLHDLKNTYKSAGSNRFEVEFIGLRNLFWAQVRASVGNIKRTHSFTYNSIRIWTWDAYPFFRDHKVRVAMRPPCRFDAVFDPEQWPCRMRDLYKCLLYNLQTLLNYFPYSHAWEEPLPMGRWAYLYKTFGQQSKYYRWRRQSLVRPGWRIMARNLSTEETIELGFIDFDARDRALTDIWLPDGEYEISVLTSSLFWQDAHAGQVRTITLPTGENGMSFPTIYNLRSAVAGGVTGIYWSASHSEIDECVFGIWYSSETPVDTNRTPDATVWYNSSMTEFQTAFAQQEPQYVAVAAMNVGENREIGKVHELFLDWSDRPPRAPEDVMVLDEPLPVFDKEVEAAHEDDPFLTLWH